MSEAAGATAGIARMDLDEETPGVPRDDGAGGSQGGDAAAGEALAHANWLIEFGFADLEAPLPESLAARRLALESMYASLEEADAKCRAARQKARAAFRKCKKAGFTQRHASGAFTDLQTMRMRAYVRGLAAELDAVKERALVCDGSCKGTKAAMASTINEYIAGSLEDKQQLADCTKALLDKDRTIQTTLATLQTANEDNDKLHEQLRELRQQFQQVEEKSQAQEQAATLASKQASEMQKRLVAAMAKPAAFEGKIGNGADKGHLVRDWVASVQRYVDSAGFDDSDAIRFAASHLKGAALRAWNTRRDTLAAEGQQATLEGFFDLLKKQFGGPSVEASCRTQLDSLQQKGRFNVLSAYLAEFERLVGLIDANSTAKMTDGDKIHRFLTGLQNTVYHQHLATNPHTLTRYEVFADLRVAAETLSAAGLITDCSRKADQATQGKRFEKGSSSRPQQQQQQQDQNGPPQKRQRAYGKILTHPISGKTVFRSNQQWESCKKLGRCAWCYEKHIMKDCKSSEAARSGNAS